MAGTIKGITIEIAGNTQPLNKALESVNKQSRDIQAELKQVERLLKLDPKNTELLAQKQKLLGEAVSTTKTKLDTLKEAQKQVQQQFERGEVGEEQYRALQREIIKTEQDLKKLETAANTTAQKLKDVGDSLKNAGDKMTSAGKDMSMKVTAPIVAAGAASFKFAADLQDAMGATDQIYKASADEVKRWADSLESYYGIAEGEALEYANMMGSMLQNIGELTEEEAAKQAQTLIELAGDLTAMYGGSTSDAVRALTGALKGNNSMLDNYGMAVNEALVKTKALEMGLIAEGEQLSLSAKQAATLALIMEQTAAAQGQAAREAEGASGSLRTVMTELKNLGTEIGEVLLPMITPFIQKLGDIVKGFGELSPETQKVIIAIAAIAAAIGPLLVVLGMMTSGLGAVIGVLPVLGGALGALAGPVGTVVAAIAALIAIGVALCKNWDEITAKAKELLESLKEKFTKIKDSIGNAINTVKTTVSSGLETVRNTFSSIWNSIYSTTLSVWNGIKETIRGAINGVIGIVNSFISFWNRISLKVPEVDIPLVGKVGGWEIGLPNIPKIPMLGTGGIITKEMLAVVGDRPEAVIPIEKIDSIIASALSKAKGAGEIHLHIGTLVADELGLKQLERKLSGIRIGEQGRLGVVR